MPANILAGMCTFLLQLTVTTQNTTCNTHEGVVTTLFGTMYTHFFCTPVCRCPFSCRTCSRTLRCGTPHSRARWSHGIRPTRSMFCPRLKRYMSWSPNKILRICPMRPCAIIACNLTALSVALIVAELIGLGTLACAICALAAIAQQRLTLIVHIAIVVNCGGCVDGIRN